MLGQLAGAVADDDDAVDLGGDGSVERRQVVRRKGNTPTPALCRSTPGLPFVLGTLSRLGTLAPFLRLAAQRLGFDRLPMMEKLVVRGERNAPDLVVSIPSRKRHLPNLFHDLARIGRPNAKPVVVDT